MAAPRTRDLLWSDITAPHRAGRPITCLPTRVRPRAGGVRVEGADAADTVMLAEHAAGAVAAEQDLHAALMGELGATLEVASREPLALTTRAYLSYLLATAYGGSFAEAVGAVLPCYWIYARVGDELLALTDRIGADLSAGELARVREHFRTTSRYGWMFWDAGYRREVWPI